MSHSRHAAFAGNSSWPYVSQIRPCRLATLSPPRVMLSRRRSHSYRGNSASPASAARPGRTKPPLRLAFTAYTTWHASRAPAWPSTGQRAAAANRPPSQPGPPVLTAARHGTGQAQGRPAADGHMNPRPRPAW